MNANPPENIHAESVEALIGRWRAHLRRSRVIGQGDADELEDHLREQLDVLGAAGLSGDEAFLVAVRRIGAIDALTREFAREHSERLWKQLVFADDEDSGFAGASRKTWGALSLAVAAGVAIKLPDLLGIGFDEGTFYPRNLPFFVLPFVAVYFAWDRALSRSAWIGLAAVFTVAAVTVNLFPFDPTGSDTEVLTILHLPLALWFAVGVAYAGGRWWGSDRRMDFVRFTGELLIYYVLIGLGGGVLIATTIGLFSAIGLDAEPWVERWILPCGVAGAAVVATRLVEAKQSVVENMAPVLTRVFSPMFALLLLTFVGTKLWTGRGIDMEREMLIAFDLLLVVVFGLLLYSVSARDPEAPPGPFDWIQLTLVGAALVVDLLALGAMSSRISDFGFTPNRVAALGENLVLLVNLAVSATLYVGFLRGAAPFARLAEWQTRYLYVLAGWAAVVAFVFPLVFGFA